MSWKERDDNKASLCSISSPPLLLSKSAETKHIWNLFHVSLAGKFWLKDTVREYTISYCCEILVNEVICFRRTEALLISPYLISYVNYEQSDANVDNIVKLEMITLVALTNASPQPNPLLKSRPVPPVTSMYPPSPYSASNHPQLHPIFPTRPPPPQLPLFPQPTSRGGGNLREICLVTPNASTAGLPLSNWVCVRLSVGVLAGVLFHPNPTAPPAALCIVVL